MEELASKRSGRPRKVVEHVASESQVPAALANAYRNGEVGFVQADTARTPAPSRWGELIARINELTQAGLLITQVHTRDNRFEPYETETCVAVMHGNAEDDYLVSSSGQIHRL